MEIISEYQGLLFREVFVAETGHFSLFFEVLDSSKPPTPLHMGPFTPQICADLRGVKNPCKKGGNGGIGEKKTLPGVHVFGYSRSH